jgi:hypothetical protein
VSPDSAESRIGRLEQAVAKLEQRVSDRTQVVDQRLSDLAVEVRALAPLVISHARMELQIVAAIEEAREGRREIEKLRASISEREEGQRRERKADRRWMLGTVLTASLLIVAAIGLLVG